MPAGAAGLSVAGTFYGLGLRGNSSAPMAAAGVPVPLTAMLGTDGAGLDLAMAAVLPYFLICSAAMSAGLMRRLADETAAHLRRTHLALRAGGGAAFRKESVVERLFRDSRAARVMAPTTDALHDFIGRALLGLPLLGEA